MSHVNCFIFNSSMIFFYWSEFLKFEIYICDVPNNITDRKQVKIRYHRNHTNKH